MKTQALSLLCAVCSNQLAYLVCTVRARVHSGEGTRWLGSRFIRNSKEFPAE